MYRLVKYLFVTIIIVFLHISPDTIGQGIEHNYLVGPQNTSCDSLPKTFANLEKAISLIENATFRSSEKFTINRKFGVQGGWYYSCDNKTGYLIILQDNYKLLFHGVPKSVWDAFIITTDFETFMDENLRSYQYRFLRE
ncbi:MAG: hypothetical protein JW731_07535 [Bacteroidales bacterium]|nr:hypothetical protein [Bacteroidales bacterium]